jgi:two-component system, chemotaxis family, protein-glutamate methylesterase/glutaminase
MPAQKDTVSRERSKRRIRVLIVDDSALVRRMLTEMLSTSSDIEVVGSAGDAYMARNKIKQLDPDVITLDIEMPKMDGVTFLRNLMRLRPMPVILVSSLTDHGASVTLEALSIGAVDYLPKPKVDLAATFSDYAEDLVGKIKVAARARVRHHSPPEAIERRRSARPPPSMRGAGGAHHLRTTERVIAIGASTGGTEAIRELLAGLPADTPGILVAQHIPGTFSQAFAARLNACSAVTVQEARDGQQVLAGHVYIAPGDLHLRLVRDGARYVCRLDDGEPVNRHKPSVDVLFGSVARHAGPNAAGVLLTGMGKDGALGLLEMRQAGSPTIAQDETSSLIWGMPGEAVALGAADHVLPIARIGDALLQLLCAGASEYCPS